LSRCACACWPTYAPRIRALSGRLLTSGNTAKLHCLKLIEQAAAELDGEFRIVDLGCGNGSNFVELLRRRPGIRYVGVEPLRAAAEDARRKLPRAEIIKAPAYDVRVEPAHAVVSFSVLEHVVDRPRYFEAVRENLRPDGRVYLNYDSGHFVADADLGERAKALVARALARLGFESRYRARVSAAEFRELVERSGLRILDDKVFNTDVKRLLPLVGEESRDSFMERWLAFELGLNDLGLAYRDELDAVFRTRNVILERI
jgi:cyclopropane fatty-acyl-phospholipid synthase-like methyltransferase